MIELSLWFVVSELAIIILLLVQVNVSNPTPVDWIKIIYEFVRVVGPLLFIGFSIYFFYVLFLKI
jgi:hypothetical protein